MIYLIPKEELEKADKMDTPWTIHYVYDEEQESCKNGRFDMHTHDLEDEVGTELQLTIHINGSVKDAARFVNMVANLMRMGYPFREGDEVCGPLYNVPVGFIKVKDSMGEDVLRIFIPDAQGHIYGRAVGIYAQQYNDPYLSKIS